jgi:hypothetical protein
VGHRSARQPGALLLVQFDDRRHDRSVSKGRDRGRGCPRSRGVGGAHGERVVDLAGERSVRSRWDVVTAPSRRLRGYRPVHRGVPFAGPHGGDVHPAIADRADSGLDRSGASRGHTVLGPVWGTIMALIWSIVAGTMDNLRADLGSRKARPPPPDLAGVLGGCCPSIDRPFVGPVIPPYLRAMNAWVGDASLAPVPGRLDRPAQTQPVRSGESPAEERASSSSLDRALRSASASAWSRRSPSDRRVRSRRGSSSWKTTPPCRLVEMQAAADGDIEQIGG